MLKTIPYKEINTTTLTVEFRHGDNQQHINVMPNNSYRVAKELKIDKPEIFVYVRDFIFVKN